MSGENLHIKYYKNALVFLWKKTENDCYKIKMFCKAKRLNSLFLKSVQPVLHYVLNIPGARAKNRKYNAYFYPLTFFSLWNKAATSKKQFKRHHTAQDTTRNVMMMM
jgi:hypothetical protein